MYMLSIALPPLLMLAVGFLVVKQWHGWLYFRSKDAKVRAIGLNALVLISISTVVTTWFIVVWTQQVIQSTTNSINADMSGGLGS